MTEWVTVDPEAEAKFLEDMKPALEEASRLSGWPVDGIAYVDYVGRGPRTNARVWNLYGGYMDIRLPEELLK